MKTKGIYLRIDDTTQIAMNLLANELGIATGKKVSANAALWALFLECRPKIAEHAKELKKQQQTSNGKNDK